MMSEYAVCEISHCEISHQILMKLTINVLDMKKVFTDAIGFTDFFHDIRCEKTGKCDGAWLFPQKNILAQIWKG